MINQRAWRALRLGGLLVAAGGAGALIVGAALPWALVPVFGMDLTIPGVAAGWGAVTLIAGALALRYASRFPLVGVLLGLIALSVGAQAGATTGRAVRGRLLALNNALYPVNDKLIRAGLAPVEPFGYARSWASLVGPGPRVTVWGGAALALGAAAMLVGERMGRVCPRCSFRWSSTRTAVVAFCPACGARVGPPVACPACQASVEPGDRFCAACGTTLAG